MFTPEVKKAVSFVAKDTNSKTSTRIMSFMYYMVIRTCEVIDWWFPTEHEKLQRKRAKACVKDPPNIPKGATVEIDPNTGAAMEEKSQ
jgi:hypothetical protein